MGYLFRQTEKYFKERILDGEQTWNSLKSKIEFVIAHPNGWGTEEQGILRKASIAANLVTSSAAKDRVHFVSEAEASVHFVMLHSDLSNHMKVRQMPAIPERR